jgi:hypothetical protein
MAPKFVWPHFCMRLTELDAEACFALRAAHGTGQEAQGLALLDKAMGSVGDGSHHTIDERSRGRAVPLQTRSGVNQTMIGNTSANPCQRVAGNGDIAVPCQVAR